MIQQPKIPAFAITGAPGSGKGTQAHLLQDRLNFLHVSSGDVFRHAIDRNAPAAIQAKDLMVRGELVPDDLIETMVRDELEMVLKKHPEARGLILDGFPRTLDQAAMLEQMMEELPLQFKGMISLQTPEDIVLNRLLNRAEIEHRADDNEEVIKDRLRVWREKTLPLEQYYSEHNQLYSVDGVGHTEEVYSRLVPILMASSLK